MAADDVTQGRNRLDRRRAGAAAGCRAFYVVPAPVRRNATRSTRTTPCCAQIRGIPTLNGYSSWFPDGWALDEPASPGYAAAVRAWVEKTHIEGEVCGLEPRSGRWVEGLRGSGILQGRT